VAPKHCQHASKLIEVMHAAPSKGSPEPPIAPDSPAATQQFAAVAGRRAPAVRRELLAPGKPVIDRALLLARLPFLRAPPLLGATALREWRTRNMAETPAGARLYLI